MFFNDYVYSVGMYKNDTDKMVVKYKGFKMFKLNKSIALAVIFGIVSAQGMENSQMHRHLWIPMDAALKADIEFIFIPPTLVSPQRQAVRGQANEMIDSKYEAEKFRREQIILIREREAEEFRNLDEITGISTHVLEIGRTHRKNNVVRKLFQLKLAHKDKNSIFSFLPKELINDIMVLHIQDYLG